MPEIPSKAVFLSYSSQDIAAARRLATGLQAVGIEVWFDAEGGLQTGDAWDAKIRQQIRDCLLFVPIISASTESRPEGYFRIEWDLAAERARGVAAGIPFILPVTIDDTREPGALVPDRFRVVQWTKVPGGDLPPEAAQRFARLWTQRIGGGERTVRPATGHPVDSTVPPAPKLGRRVAVAAGLIALGAGLAWWALAPRGKEQERSLAVLPFENLSGEAKNAYLSEGISDEVSAAMVGLGKINVVARSSAYALKGRSLDVREMAKQLGVQYLLEGRVHEVDHQTLRVTADLVKAADGFRVWSKSYRSDIGSIQREIIAALRREILPELKSTAGSRTPTTTDHPEAYDHYLRGRHAYGNWSRESLERAIKELESATTLDPEFGIAWALLGEAMITLDDVHLRRRLAERPNVYPAVLALAGRAEKAGRPAAGEAHALRAHVRIHELKFREAELESLQAIALSPHSSNAQQWYGHVLHFKGRFAESERQLERSLRLEVESLGRAELWLTTRRSLAAYSGRTDLAERTIAELAALGVAAVPLHQKILILVQRRRFAEARAVLAELSGKAGQNSEAGEPNVRWLLVYTEAAAGNLAEARQRRAEIPAREGTVMVRVLACLALQDPAGALDIIGESKDESLLGVFYLRGLPEFQQLAGQPRWRALLSRVGLE